MTLYYVQPGRAVQLVQAGDGTTLIVNRDPNNTLLLGPTAAVSKANQQNLSIVDPLGSRTVQGLIDVWGVAETAEIEVDVQNDAMAWSASPAQIAAQIQASGIFINTNSTQILDSASTVVPSSGSVVIGTYDVKQIGYEIRVSSRWNGAPNPIDDFQCGVQLDWLDSTTGQIVCTDQWAVGASSSASANLLTAGSGPTKGNQVQVTFFNSDPSGANVTISCVMLLNSRTYVKDVWRWTQPAGAIAFTNYQQPILKYGENLLADFAFNQPANSKLYYPLGLWAGRFSMSWLEGAQGWNGGQPNVTWAVILRGIAGGAKVPLREYDGEVELIASRFPIAVEVNNLVASSSTSSFFAIGLD